LSFKTFLWNVNIDLSGNSWILKWFSSRWIFCSGNHPRAGFLGLANINCNGSTIPPNDRVTMLSASAIRASLVTESGRVATWMDETVSHICGKLEHTATAFPDLSGDRWIINRDFFIIIWFVNRCHISCCKYRVTDKEWDFRDDCTKFILSAYIHDFLQL